MEILITLGIVFIVTALICAYFYYLADEDDEIGSVGCWTLIVGLVLMLSGMLLHLVKKSKEIPIKTYSVKMRVTESHGKPDTTYVLIPKNK